MSTKAARAGLGAIVAVLVVGISPGSANAYVYWTNDYVGPNRANLDGSGVDSRFIDDENCEGCLALAVDEAYVYWTSSNAVGDSFIGRAKLDGSGMKPTFIGPLGKQPREGGLAVDSAHIYWANGTPCCDGGAIARANLDGSGVDEWFIPMGVGGVNGVSVDGTHIYWTEWSSPFSPGSLGRSNLDGSDVDHSFISDVPLWGTAVDSEHIYWATGGGSIARADLDGSHIDRSFITGGHNTSAVAVDGSHIYWTNRLSSLPGSIGRANLDGSDVDQNFIVPPIDGNPIEPEFGSGPSGVAVDGAITLDRASIAFQPRPDHTRSQRKLVTLTNTESLDVTVNGVATTGADGTSFRVRGDLCTGHTLGPGQSCTVLVRFRPQGTGAKTARLRFDHSGSPQSVLLSGTGKPGPWLEGQPRFSFGYHPLGTSVAQAWGINNVGSAPMEISDLTVEGPNPGDFEFSGDCIGATTLGPGGQCTAIITFRPTARGPRFAKLTITHTAPRSPSHTAFQGRGR